MWSKRRPNKWQWSSIREQRSTYFERRIQDVHNNPVYPGAPAGEETMDEETAGPTTNTTWIDREYIHTAGPGSYVDEFICETDRVGVPLYHLQEANFNPVGLGNIATNKGSFADRFRDLFRQAGIQGNLLSDRANIVRIPHSGRHNPAYHKWVLKELRGAIGSLRGNDAADAVRERMRTIGRFLRQNPDFLYDTIGRAPTRFRGMRHLTQMLPSGRYRHSPPR